jgi:hypothetical protein
MVSQLNFEIVQKKSQIIDKFDMYRDSWKKKPGFYRIFQKSEMNKMVKAIEKSQSMNEIENFIQVF